MQPSSSETIEGEVIFFHQDNRGWGFIRRDDGVLPDVFVNRIDVSGQGDLRKGQRVSFQVEQRQKGPIAKRVRVLDVVASYDGRRA